MGQEFVIYVLITNGATLLLLYLIWLISRRLGAFQAPTLTALCIAAGFWGWLLLIKREALASETLNTLASLQYAVATIVPSLWLLFVIATTGHRDWVMVRRWPALVLLAGPILIVGMLFSPRTALAANVRFWVTLPMLFLGSLVLANTLWPMYKERRWPTVFGLVAASAPALSISASIGASTLSLSVPELTPLLCGASGLILSLISAPIRPLQPHRHTTAFWSLGRAGGDIPATQPELPAIVSHELRHLVSGIVSASDILARTQLDPNQRSLLDMVRTSGNVMLKVVNSTLELSALEISRPTPRQAAFSLRACIEESLDTIAIEALHKRLDLGYVIADSVPDRLIGDSTRLGQIVLNLVANSVKFTDHGGIFISAHGRKLAGQRLALHLSIADSGPGIPDEHQAYLFQPFYRTPGRAPGQQPGSGLGLAISRQIAILMGGDLTLEHTSASGTTFAVVVQVQLDPAAPPAPPRHHPGLLGKRLLIVGAESPCRAMIARTAAEWGMEIHTTTLTDTDRWTDAERNCAATLVIADDTPTSTAQLHAALATLTQAPPIGLVMWLDHNAEIYPASMARRQSVIYRPIHYHDLRGMLLRLVGIADEAAPSDSPPPETPIATQQILLVDDDALIRGVTRQMLEALGHHVAESPTGEAALEAIRHTAYDVVLLDMHLADLYGTEIAQKIRRAAAGAHQPYLIAFTGEYRSEPAADHRQAGINAWLVKPVTSAALTAVLADSVRWRARAAGGSPRAAALQDPPYQAAPASNEPIADFLHQVGLRGPSARVFIDQYLDDSERLVREMRASFERGQTTNIARAAHQLKSSSALFNHQRLTRLCQQLDALTRADAPSDYAHHIELIEHEYRRLRAQLTASDRIDHS